MPLPAAAHLIEFPLAPQVNGAGGQGSIAPCRLEESAATSDAEAAFARGREEGLAAGRAEIAAQLEGERAAAEQHLSDARAEWASQEGTRAAALIGAAFDTLETKIGDTVAAILAPFLRERLRMRAAEDLAGILAPLLAGAERPVVRVAGPADLLDAIRMALGAAASSVAFEAGDGIDVRAVADQTLIETRLQDWLRRIGEESA